MTSKTTNDAKSTYHHGDLRNGLLNAAETELAEKGIEAFSLRSVAKRAGVSHAAPAHHFGDAKGLLTALATLGYQRFIETQQSRQRNAPTDPKAQLVASGLGYIEFAMANPALFRLMFSSNKPDINNEALATASFNAFDKLVKEIQGISQSDPYVDSIAMVDVMAAWAIAHGLSDLMIAGRMSFIQNMEQPTRDTVLSDIILRAYKNKPDQ